MQQPPSEVRNLIPACHSRELEYRTCNFLHSAVLQAYPFA